MSGKLLPCPRCGSDIEIGTDDNELSWWYCTNLQCKCELDADLCLHDSKDEAIACANRREPPPATRAMLDLAHERVTRHGKALAVSAAFLEEWGWPARRIVVKGPKIDSIARVIKELKALKGAIKALAEVEAQNGRVPPGCAAMVEKSYTPYINGCITYLESLETREPRATPAEREEGE